MVEDVPYNTRCRVARPTYFLEGIFRPLPGDKVHLFSLVDIAILQLQAKRLKTTQSQREVDGFIRDVAEQRIVRFLFYSDGQPCSDLYNLASLEKDPVLTVVPTFNTDEMAATFPLRGLEGICAGFQLRLAGIKGPHSYIQNEQREYGQP